MTTAEIVGVCATLAAFTVVGCSDATGTVQGGGSTLDASVPQPPPPSSSGDAGTATFAGLYVDFFGPAGKASCAGDGQCHGAAGQAGARATSTDANPVGYVCAPDKDGCYRNMTNAGLVSTDGGTAPEQTPLYLVLRKSTGGGSMPLRPSSFTFSPDDMQRIRSWIAGGAKND